MAGNRPLGPVQVTLEEAGGSFEKMLRRFVRRVREEGRVAEVLERRRGFVKPSQRRRKRSRNAAVGRNSGATR